MAPRLAQLPYRGDGSARPDGLAVPPARMPMLEGAHPLKRWRYLGVYTRELMLCAGDVASPLPAGRWAARCRWLLDGMLQARRGEARTGRLMGQRSRRSTSTRGSDAVRDRSPTEPRRLYIWTRSARVPVRGAVEPRKAPRDGRGQPSSTIPPAITHATPRGSGPQASGRGDGRARLEPRRRRARRRAASERTVWVDGEPHETAVVSFDPGLAALSFAGGEQLDFSKEAEHAPNDDLGVFASEYAQPFGTFSGTLPGESSWRRASA